MDFRSDYHKLSQKHFAAMREFFRNASEARAKWENLERDGLMIAAASWKETYQAQLDMAIEECDAAISFHKLANGEIRH